MSIGSVDVYHGDCLDILPTLEAESVDAIVTDPPFGIGFRYGTEKDVASDPTTYWDWLKPRMDAALACLKPGGFVAVWQTQVYFRHFWDWFGPDIHVYCAAKNFVQMRPTPIIYGYDPVVMFYKPGGPLLRPDNPQRSVDFFVADTASVVFQKGRPEKRHPCPRPLDQVRVILDNFVLPGGLVLDPFVGSGTTLLASLKTGRVGVGIEIEDRYVSIIRHRLEGVRTPLFGRMAETPLFDEVSA